MQQLKKIMVLLSAFVLTWNLVAATAIPAGEWTISTNGKTDKAIVKAAAELQELLAVRIGKKIAVQTDKKAVREPVIVLGEYEPKLGWDSFRIVRKGNTIHIIGNNPLGTLFGVYEFVQRYCDVWHVAPGAIYAPKGKPLSFGDMDLTMHPAIAWRRIYHTGSDWHDSKSRAKWIDYDRRSRVTLSAYIAPEFVQYVNPQYRMSHTVSKQEHTFYDFVPPAKYGKTHPEYFSIDKTGVRNMNGNAGGQLCLSHPDVEKIVYERLMEGIAKEMAKTPGNRCLTFKFTQMDNSSILCFCPNCQKIIKQYGNRDSALLIWFLNKIARKVKKTHPDVILHTSAYVNTEEPPVGLNADDNLMIGPCDLYTKSCHILPLSHEVNKPRQEIIRSWVGVTKKLRVWDYILQDGNVPMTPADAIGPDAKFFRSCGVMCIMAETEDCRGCEASFVHLKNFLLAQLYFNPDLDTEKLIDVFCRGFYGDAHARMKEYLNFIRSEQKKHPTTDLQKWHMRDMAHVNMDFLRKGKAMVLEAMKINKDPVVELRILSELNVLDTALTNLMAAYPKMAAERKELLQQLLKNRIRYTDAQGLVKEEYDRVVRKIRLPIEESMLVFTDIPEELKKLPAGKIRFLGSSRITTGNHAKRTPDPEAPLGKAVFWKPANSKAFKTDIPFGTFDWVWHKTFTSTRIQAKTDEKYHWYKLFTSTIGPNTFIYCLDWQIGVRVKGLFVISDGLTGKDDPNMYEFWVSMKCQGPAYNPASKKENAVVIDRAMMVPVKK